MGISVTLRGGSGDMTKAVYDPDLDGVIALAETEADMTKAVFDSDGDNVLDKDVVRKIAAASDVLRKTDDAVVNTVETVYALRKSITIPKNYVTSGLRIKFDIADNSTGSYGDGKIYKNGVAVGTERSASGGVDEYNSFSEDLGGFAPGDTIELWSKTTNVGVICRVKDFRIKGSDSIVNEGW